MAAKELWELRLADGEWGMEEAAAFLRLARHAPTMYGVMAAAYRHRTERPMYRGYSGRVLDRMLRRHLSERAPV